MYAAAQRIVERHSISGKERIAQTAVPAKSAAAHQKNIDSVRYVPTALSSPVILFASFHSSLFINDPSMMGLKLCL